MNMITKAAIKEKGFYCKYLKNPNINNYILLVIIRNKFFVFVHTGDAFLMFIKIENMNNFLNDELFNQSLDKREQ